MARVVKQIRDDNVLLLAVAAMSEAAQYKNVFASKGVKLLSNFVCIWYGPVGRE
jgi:hypothetical protein